MKAEAESTCMDIQMEGTGNTKLQVEKIIEMVSVLLDNKV